MVGECPDLRREWGWRDARRSRFPSPLRVGPLPSRSNRLNMHRSFGHRATRPPDRPQWVPRSDWLGERLECQPAKPSRVYSQAQAPRYRGSIPLVGTARGSKGVSPTTIRRAGPERRWEKKVDGSHRRLSMISPRRKVHLQRSQRATVTTVAVTHLHLARV